MNPAVKNSRFLKKNKIAYKKIFYFFSPRRSIYVIEINIIRRVIDDFHVKNKIRCHCVRCLLLSTTVIATLSLSSCFSRICLLRGSWPVAVVCPFWRMQMATWHVKIFSSRVFRETSIHSLQSFALSVLPVLTKERSRQREMQKRTLAKSRRPNRTTSL